MPLSKVALKVTQTKPKLKRLKNIL